jgi:hypothetical protein
MILSENRIPLGSCAIYRFINLSTTSCGVGASYRQFTVDDRAGAAISGFNQLIAFPARAATVSGRRSASSIAARLQHAIVTASVSGCCAGRTGFVIGSDREFTGRSARDENGPGNS